MPPPDDTHVYSVTELTRRIRSVLEQGIGSVWVEGELSNVRRPASGHCYFTIKDETAQLRAVVWRSDLRLLACAPADGLLVRAGGAITVYERDGSYQLVVRRLEPGGKGSLQARFEALKKKLEAEGLFAAARKRPLPLLPQHIGIVTSPTGAAIRDMLNVLTRRFPNLHIALAPARVQGEGAAEEIAAAVDLLNAQGGYDVLIVGRGGGSLEDLWAFNEEVVARAIARSRIPVISAVGHETDFTISDFVADLRAPTPSAAAELVVGRKDAFERELAQHSAALARALRQAWLEARARFLAAAGHYVFREPANLVRLYRQRLEGLGVRLRRRLEDRAREAQQGLDDLALRLTQRVQASRTLWRQQVSGLERQLAALSPLAVLERGYSLTRTCDGRVVRSAGELRKGQAVVTRVARGSFESEVTDTHEQKEG
jgi:exodeoxyribonuclease VII large subunit